MYIHVHVVLYNLFSDAFGWNKAWYGYVLLALIINYDIIIHVHVVMIKTYFICPLWTVTN